MFPDPDLTKTDSIALYNRAIYNKNTKNTHSIVHTRDLRPPLLIGLWQWMKNVCHLFPISLNMCPPCCHSNFLVGGYDHKAFGVEHCLSHVLWNSITKLSKFALLFVRLWEGVKNKTRVLLCKRLFGSGQDLIIRAQSTAIFLCIQPFSSWWRTITTNGMILEQACSWPVRRQSFAKRA